MRNFILSISVEERAVTVLCVKICEKKWQTFIKTYVIHLVEASDRMVTVSVFQSRVKLHILQFYRDYYGKLQAGKPGITISVEEFQEFTKLIPKLQQDVLNMNFKLLEDEKPEVVFPGDFYVTIIPSPPSPPSSAVDTDVNHEMLTPQWKEKGNH